MAESPRTLSIGLLAWIIQDGNYGDFRRGDVRAFALTFYAANPLTPVPFAPGLAASLRSIGGDAYRVIGRDVHDGGDWQVIDVGVLAYCDHGPPRDIPAGAPFKGELVLGVDPFPYFERLSKREGAPALIYDWRIERIDIQTAPFINRNGVLIRDPERLGWREVRRTDAWGDNGGHAEYLLHCERLGDEPRRTLRP